MTPPVVAYVEWVDAAHLARTWETADRLRERAAEVIAVTVRSAGLLLADDDDHVLLAVAHNPDNDDVGTALAIPRSAIRRIDVWVPQGLG